jgi:membrane protease YdiL (CAAX protease family)
VNHDNVNGQRGAPAGRRDLYEVVVFIFLILPALFLPYLTPTRIPAGFTFTAAATILHNLAYLCLIAFFLWTNGEPKRRIGWVGGHAAREMMLGFWLFLLMTLTATLIQQAIQAARISLPSHPVPSSLIARTPAGYVLTFVLVVVVAVSEETIFRGYLMLRLASVTRSRTAALLISTAIFSLGHSYEGLPGIVAVFFIGLYLGIIYMWRGSLVAPMTIHFLQDFVGLFGAALSRHLSG